jgi:hypothetical protein
MLNPRLLLSEIASDNNLARKLGSTLLGHMTRCFKHTEAFTRILTFSVLCQSWTGKDLTVRRESLAWWGVTSY